MVLLFKYFKVIAVLMLLSDFGALHAQTGLTDSLIQQLPHTTGAAKVYLLSDISYYFGGRNNQKSIHYASECLKEAKKTGDDALISEGYNAQAIAYYNNGNFRSALKANFNALNIRKQKGEPKSMISSYSKIANCYNDLGNYPEAIKYNLKALKLAEKNKMHSYSGMIYTNIGLTYKEQNKPGKALKYYLKAAAIAKKDTDTISWAKAMNNAGVVYKDMNRFEEAKSAYSKSYRLIRGKQFPALEGSILMNLGALEANKGNSDQAFVYYKQALPMLETANDGHSLAILYGNLGNRYSKNGNLDSAELLLKKSIELSTTLELKNQLAESYKGLGHLYFLTGNYKEAYSNDKKADSLFNQLINVENAKILEELNIRYATEKRKKELAEQEVLIQEKNNLIIKIAFGFSLFILIAILIYLVLIQRQRKLRQKIELEKAEADLRLQKEKLRISRELHDNIGAQLTFSITSLDELSKKSENLGIKKSLNEVRKHAQLTMNELRESIWTIRSEKVTVDELIGKVADFIQKAKETGVKPHLVNLLTEKELHQELSPQEAIGILRVIQEALNNAIKHSKSKNISIRFEIGKISIEDDGIGFDAGTPSFGFGIDNMRNRTEELGYTLEISSGRGKGTTVMIRLEK